MKITFFIPTLLEFKFLFPNNTLKDNGLYKTASFKDITVVVSGMGKTNVTLSATHFFTKNKDIKSDVYLIGICGCYRESNLTLGEIVSIEEDYFVDESIFENNSLLMLNTLGFPICKDNKTIFSKYNKLKRVNGNTVSILPGNFDLASIFHKTTGAKVESMEGASFGLVCQKFGITSYQIRAISNYCGERDKKNWKIDSALTNLKAFVDSLLSVKQ